MRRVPLTLAPDASRRVSVGLASVFPPELVEDMAVDLGRGLDEYVPPMVCEAAVVAFVQALQSAGWEIRRPETDTRSLASAGTA